MGDIEKAFLMISICGPDRDSLRFLWIDNTQAPEPNILKLLFIRVMFGVMSSPFLLHATLHHHMEKFSAMTPSLSRNSFVASTLMTSFREPPMMMQLTSFTSK